MCTQCLLGDTRCHFILDIRGVYSVFFGVLGVISYYILQVGVLGAISKLTSICMNLIVFQIKFDKTRWSCYGMVTKTVHKILPGGDGVKGVVRFI